MEEDGRNDIDGGVDAKYGLTPGLTLDLFGVHPQRPLPHLQELNPYGEVHYITDLNGDIETRTATMALAVELLDGGRLSLQLRDRFEHLTEDFQVHPEAVIPAGEYPFREGNVAFRSSKGRSLSGTASVTWGGFFNGKKTTVDLSALWRVDRHLSFDVFMQRNEVSLPELDFSADVVGGRVDLAATTRLYLSAFVQYNASSEEAVSNLRFNFIHSCLSDLFVVYTERRSTAGLGVLDRAFTVKVTKMLEF